MDLAPDLRDLLEELVRGGVEFVIVGGYAVAYHARPRATKDIDLVLEPSRENLVRASAALARFGAPPNVVGRAHDVLDAELLERVRRRQTEGAGR